MSKNFEITGQADCLHCDLGSMRDLRAAVPLKSALLAALGKKRPLTLDASAVEQVSTACVQLLVAAQAAFAHINLSLTLQNPSPAIADAFGDLGLQTVMQQPMMES